MLNWVVNHDMNDIDTVIIRFLSILSEQEFLIVDTSNSWHIVVT